MPEKCPVSDYAAFGQAPTSYVVQFPSLLPRPPDNTPSVPVPVPKRRVQPQRQDQHGAMALLSDAQTLRCKRKCGSNRENTHATTRTVSTPAMLAHDASVTRSSMHAGRR